MDLFTPSPTPPLTLLKENIDPNTPIVNKNWSRTKFKRSNSLNESFNKKTKLYKENTNVDERIQKMEKEIFSLKEEINHLSKSIENSTSPNKVLEYKEIVGREWKEVGNSQEAICKLKKEFIAVQKAKRPSGCISFGTSKEEIKREIVTSKDHATVARSFEKDNQDFAWNGVLSLDLKFSKEEMRTPFWAVCDGHGLRGRHASKFVATEYPKIFMNNLREFNPKEWTDEGIFNAFKISCTEMDAQFEEGYNGGTTMVFCTVLEGYVWFASVGDSPAIILNGNKEIPMTRDASADDLDFVRSVLKRGGVINESGRANGEINVLRDFGNKVPKLKGTTGHKVLTPRCKITRFPINELEKDHYILLYSDGPAVVANPEQLRQSVRRNEKIVECPEGFAPLAKEVLKDVLKVGERHKDDCTLQIFRINLTQEK